jgi:hypothetical protein
MNPVLRAIKQHSPLVLQLYWQPCRQIELDDYVTPDIEGSL